MRVARAILLGGREEGQPPVGCKVQGDWIFGFLSLRG